MSTAMRDDFLEFAGISTLIELDTKHLEEAKACSDKGDTSPIRWSLYLQTLARLGFAEWLRKRSPQLKTAPQVQSETDSIQDPDTTCYLQIGDFKVCLIVNTSFSEPEVILSRTCIDTPEYAAHFYCVMRLSEEEDIIAIQGFCRYDELLNLRSTQTTDREGNYTIAIAGFNPDVDELLLNLECLDPEAIALPTVSDQPARIKPPLVNVGRWLQRQLDEVRDELGWILMPTPALLRKGSIPMSPLEDTLTEIKRQTGMHIPVTAVRGYQDFPKPLPPLTRNRGSSSVRLSVVSWPLPEVENEWSLLLVLGAMPDDSPPYGARLEVWDETQVLVEEELRNENHSAYLYAQVEGTVEERFEARITLTGETEPFVFPFTYRPEELGS